MVKIFQYLRKVVNRETDTGDMESAEKRLSGLLDVSVVAGTPSVAEQIARWSKMEVIDLSKLDFGKVRKKFSQSSYKNIEVADLRAFIEKKLQPMITENINRINFAKRFQEIINEYNTGSMSVEAYFEELVKFSEGLREEEKRHLKENLTEEELELFDLLNKDGLTKNEAQEVKLAAKKLLERLKDEKNRVLIQDWHKDTQSRLSVKSVMSDVLNKTLPQSYDPTICNEKSSSIFEHFYNLAESGREFYLSAN
jgi:type I restriction enzyme R subunit